jgi:predicted CoA-binding protein
MSGRAPDDQELAALLRGIHEVAVVGLSPRPDRPSHMVAAYLQRHGYHVIPVRPGVREVLGERAYADVADLPDPPDAVVVFRRPADVPPVAAAAVRRGAKVLWLQQGITHDAAEEQAQAAGLTVVSDRCIMQEHHRLLGAG